MTNTVSQGAVGAAPAASAEEAVLLNIKGIVQGVGFRPFVYRVAKEEGVTGWVINNAEGVLVHAEGSPEAVDAFTLRLANEQPPAAKVETIEIEEVPVEGFNAFNIQASDVDEVAYPTLVSPDLGMCAACEAELFDPADRRYHYPFINCTNCGPRFTILNKLPYDRPHTSMASFEMCPQCNGEYHDPENRRFHAQPDACFTCGPQLGWLDLRAGAAGGSDVASVDVNVAAGEELRADKALAGTPEDLLERMEWAHDRASSDALIERTVALLRKGGIVAVKGLGGYHLVCDASDPEAIATLRQRKHRDGKPLAVMARNVEMAREYCLVSDDEATLMTAPARPIVLLHKRPKVIFAKGLADGVPELGVLLPATPVQALLSAAFDGLLVMTSGNLHEAPICASEEEALAQLGGVADALLANNRAIVSRYDDSVLRAIKLPDGSSMVQMIRRARGFAPTPISLAALQDVAGSNLREAADGDSPSAVSACTAPTHTATDACTEAPCVLAVGSQQKNTFTLTRGMEAFVSQHIGNVSSAPVLDAWYATERHYERLFQCHPTEYACDLHPEYLLSKWVRQTAPETPRVEVQHHFAHVLSVMGEAGLQPPVFGFSFDGTGYGPDGAIWGGEALLCNYADYERVANLAYFPLPGGEAAIKQPVRGAYGLLWACDLLPDEDAALDEDGGLLPDEAIPGEDGELQPGDDRALIRKAQKQAGIWLQEQDAALMEMCQAQVEKGLNAPFTSSMGRLFDAVSALVGACPEGATYEGQPAILLEDLLWEGLRGSTQQWLQEHPEQEAPYQFALVKNTATKDSTAHETSLVLVDPQPVIAQVLADLADGVPAGVIAKRFHDAVADVCVLLSRFVEAMYEIQTVALTGGVFQNRYLMERLLADMSQAGFVCAVNQELPANDGNISFGQAVAALAR